MDRAKSAIDDGDDGADAYYERVWTSVPPGATPERFAARRTFLLAHIAAGERVLDLGCGEGAFSAELLGAGAHPIGVEVAREPLRRARAREPRLDLRLQPPGAQLPLDDASVDVVWAGEVIEHVRDTAAWLSDLRRVLRPGGRLLLTTPDHGRLAVLLLALRGAAFDRHFDPRSDHLRFYTRRTLRALLDDFGFEAIELRAAGPPLRRTLFAAARRGRW